MAPEPPPVAATVEALLGEEIEALEVELRMVDARLRRIGWDRPSPRRLSIGEEWARLAGTLQVEDDGGGDSIAHTVLTSKRDHLLQRLSELRSRLTGQPTGTRRGGWG